MKGLILLPAFFFLMLLAGCALRRARPRLARALRIGAIVLLWLACTPVVGGILLRSLQPEPLPPNPRTDAGAIVVLSAGLDLEAEEFGGPTIDRMTWQRLRYGAKLHRATALPVLITGGGLAPGVRAIATIMAEAMQHELGVPTQWVEDRAGNTWENAVFSAEILRAAGIDRVLLVTHAWHMPRARSAFERQGLTVEVAPTGFRGPALRSWGSLLPSWKALRDTSLACHEWFGCCYYAVAY